MEMVATKKAIKDETFRRLSEELAPGQHLVDCSVRLRGVLKKGNPFRTKVPAAANPWRLLAKALSKLNSCTIESIVRESMEISDEETEAVKDEAAKAIEQIVASTERESTGRLTGEVLWSLI